MSAAEQTHIERKIKNSVSMRDFGSKNLAKIFTIGEGDPIPPPKVLGTIFGRAVATDITDKGQYGPSIVINGVFDAENYTTGEVTRVKTVFLPDAFAQTVKGSLDRLKEKDPDAALEFEVEIIAEYTGKAIPFQYICRAITHKNVEDPLAHLWELRKQRKAGTAALTHEPQGPGLFDTVQEKEPVPVDEYPERAE